MTLAEKEIFLNAGFTQDQVEEIELGQKSGLNVAVYAKKDFLTIQMRQIRLGLMEHLPVEVYAKTEYDWFQMEEIREGLKSRVDVRIYASSDIPYEKMRQIRKGLEIGIDLSAFLAFNAGVIRQLRKAKLSGVNIAKYISSGYDAEQLAEIREALEAGVDLDPYLSKDYRAASIAEIRKGLEAGLDVSVYALVYYSWRQMREIRLGLEHQVDVAKYNSRLYSWEQMREVRLGMEQGLDVDGYRLLRYTAGEMNKKRLALLEDILQEQKRIQESRIKTEDFKIEISANAMEAYVTLLAERKVVTKERLLEILAENGICAGIQEDAVEMIVSGKTGRRAILVARGEIPHKGEDGWYEFFFRTNVEKKPRVLEDGSVDYQNIEWFETVRQGQKLAYYHSAEEGIDGYTVSGACVKARKGVEQRILVGKGFVLEDDKRTYTATMDGMITLEDRSMNITRHMMLEEVTMATGNINFDGSIHILGDVGNGTLIKATDDVVIDGTVEGATIESGGSVILKKGMNSAGHGQITAGKDVVSKFFEAVKVVAKENIEVDKCLNSQLYAGGKIQSSRTIAGGVAHAERGFRVNHVGNHAGLPTVLKLKVDDKIWEENRRVQTGIQDVERELQMLKNAYDDFREKFPPEVRNNMEVFRKVENAVHTKSKQLSQLRDLKEQIEQKIQLANEAKVVITGQAHEGTVLEMNGSRWYAENQFNVTIKKKENQMEVLTN